MARGLAKVGTVAKGVAKGMAGFMDFKKAFEDAVRKNQWEKEKRKEEQIEGRYKQAGDWGARPNQADMGAYLAGGNVPMAMMPSPEGYLQLPTGKYAKVPNWRPQDYAENLQGAIKAIQDGKDPWKVYQKMASEYSEYSVELKRILMPTTKLGELDVSDLLWGK